MAKTKTVVTVISKISDRVTAENAALVVIYGLDLGRKYDLVRESTVIGRSSKSDIQIDQDSVSRSHAKLVLAEGVVELEDLGSTNGTFVNDQAIKGRYQLRNGDLVKIGRTILKFIAGGNIESVYHEEIYRLTTVDGLTQVYNRRYFEEALEREVSRATRYRRDLSLVLFDIDEFKRINDTYGHLAGDQVLIRIASSIRAKVRREDILARYGGEEFGLIVPEVPIKGAMQVAEKLRRLIEGQEFVFEQKRIPVTISLGVAAMDHGAPDTEALLREADTKLYAAKQGGRNRVCG